MRKAWQEVKTGKILSTHTRYMKNALVFSQSVAGGYYYNDNSLLRRSIGKTKRDSCGGVKERGKPVSGRKSPSRDYCAALFTISLRFYQLNT